jgi:hypothetical protein
MKKWQLEGFTNRIASEKLVLPDPGQSAVFCSSPVFEFRKESKFVSWCRQIAAFFIRFF